jgi:hypothetical protein
MTDPLDRVLQLVAEGKLSADDAAPLLDALSRQSKTTTGPGAGAGTGAGAGAGSGAGPRFTGADVGPIPDAGAGEPGRQPRYARVEVREGGRRVVDLRIPISLGRFALARVPGISKEQVADVEEAVKSGAHGPILDIQDTDGDGVRIVLE